MCKTVCLATALKHELQRNFYWDFKLLLLLGDCDNYPSNGWRLYNKTVHSYQCVHNKKVSTHKDSGKWWSHPFSTRFTFRIDNDVEPCDNFYDFACGNFIQENNPADESVAVDTFTLLQDNIVSQIYSALQDDNSNNNLNATFRLAKKFLETCLDRSRKCSLLSQVVQIWNTIENILEGFNMMKNCWRILLGTVLKWWHIALKNFCGIFVRISLSTLDWFLLGTLSR